MPAKKKAKPKYTAGVLCRDKGDDGLIGFFPKLSRSDAWLGGCSGLWWGRSFSSRPKRFWSLEKWRATYGLTPPRPGQAFECEVQL